MTVILRGESNPLEDILAEPNPVRQDRDLVLPPSTFAFVMDTTQGATGGVVKVYTGPQSVTLTVAERLVFWDGRKFQQTQDTSQAIQIYKTAAEGQYIVLADPVADDPERFPGAGNMAAAPPLAVGRRIVIHGPVTFPLWPGQTAKVIDGHALTHNQYLLAEVYEPEAARGGQAITAPQTGETPSTSEAQEAVAPVEYTMGERIIIRGDQVSFYMPPTGIEVVQEADSSGKKGNYVREAATLEQLEYVTLVDENGTKRIERGPQVVFPKPTERFVVEKGERKFRLIELNAQSGIYIKVTTDYQHDGDYQIVAWRGSEMVTVSPGEMLREGDELFLTGKDTPIYVPRIEQSIVIYGKDQRKHHAVAVPAGEARYYLDRVNGEVRKATGPDMFLPDPRTEVVVRRVLDDKTVGLWYPGNDQARAINAELRNEQVTREEQYLSAEPVLTATSTVLAGQAGSLARSYPSHTHGIATDYVRRGTEYTPPRTITLDTKYLGPPRISVWPGYAVMVMDPTGNRRVEIGPVDLLLEYHENLMALTLSTGRPKGSGAPIQTVYLRTISNAVGDRITVETQDLVPVTLDVSLRVNFEAEAKDEAAKWFAVEDYVALLTDHVRSRLRNLAKRHEIQEFYTDASNLIRDELLGAPVEAGARPGRLFEENAMRLYDVEILNVSIAEPQVKQLLDGAMNEALRGAIEVSQASQATERDQQLQSLERQRINERELTAETRSGAELSEIEREITKTLRVIAGGLQEAREQAEVNALARGEDRAAAEQDIALTRAGNDVAMARVTAEVDQFVRRVNAIDERLVDAIRVFGDERTVREITEALAPVAIAAGVPAVDILRTHLGGTAVAGVLDALAERPFAGRIAASNGGTDGE